MIHPTYTWSLLVIHLVAVSVWIGGQITLVTLVKIIRDNSEGLVHLVARRFARVSWSAFGVVVSSGLLLVLQVNPADKGTEYSVTLAVKLILVFLAATAVIIHSTSKQRLFIALGGAIGLMASLGALALGVLLGT